MDTYAGNAQDPITLHKYLYANGNPVSYTDPSGYMTLTMTMGGINASFSAAVNATVLIAGAGILTATRVNNVTRSRAAAKQCAASFASGLKVFNSGDCPDVRMPIVFMSELAMPGIGEHVQKSQLMGSPAILNRTALFKYSNRAAAISKCKAGLDIPVTAGGSSCDEYPFASSQQGGLAATVAKVDIRSNWVQGGILSSFYSACMIQPDVPVLSEFLVIPVEDSPKNFECRFFGAR